VEGPCSEGLRRGTLPAVLSDADAGAGADPAAQERPPRRDLALTASGQGLVFTLPDARTCGWTRAEIDAERRSGRWHRVTRGAYVEAVVWARLDAPARHLCLAQARLLLLGPGWLVARRSAAIAYGLPLIGKHPEKAQLVRHPTTRKARATTRHERLATVTPEDIAWLDGLPVTSLARTVVDIARAEVLRSGVVVADAALRRGLLPAELAAAAARMAGWRGGRRAVEVAAFASGLSESALESVSRVLFHEQAVPRPEQQVEIWVDGRFEARVDFLWREQNVVGEADGRAKYASVESLYAEKRREERLRDLGFEVVRWGWDEAWRRDPELVASVHRSLARGTRNTLVAGVQLRASAARGLAA
jgi:hypothetical protein